MKLSKYLLDKWLSITVLFVSYFIILGLLTVFKIPGELIIALTIIYCLNGLWMIFIEYMKKKKFYDMLISNTNALDQKYLVLETLERPDFYEGKLLYDALYEINKSMAERVNDYSENMNDFKEYIEMWIHEVKIPISSLVLMCHNRKAKKELPQKKDGMDERYIRQIRRLDHYVEQVLYYVRSNYTENDYLIKEVRLDKLVGNVLIKNKDDLLESGIQIFVNTKKISVLTDGKWMEFILNQIINNSLKYKKEGIDSQITIEAEEKDSKIFLYVCDNGIGIPPKDIPNVFKKTFTGENGRKGAKSTGMGLYIAKKLCVKLGHCIEIESEENEYTRVNITFGKNDFYKIK